MKRLQSRFDDSLIIPFLGDSTTQIAARNAPRIAYWNDYSEYPY